LAEILPSTELFSAQTTTQIVKSMEKEPHIPSLKESSSEMGKLEALSEEIQASERSSHLIGREIPSSSKRTLVNTIFDFGAISIKIN
jgi:hypothetical protein